MAVRKSRIFRPWLFLLCVFTLKTRMGRALDNIGKSLKIKFSLFSLMYVISEGYIFYNTIDYKLKVIFV